MNLFQSVISSYEHQSSYDKELHLHKHLGRQLVRIQYPTPQFLLVHNGYCHLLDTLKDHLHHPKRKEKCYRNLYIQMEVRLTVQASFPSIPPAQTKLSWSVKCLPRRVLRKSFSHLCLSTIGRSIFFKMTDKVPFLPVSNE